MRRLPKVPDEVLKHFRKELPADDLDEVRPVGTRTVWNPEPSEAMEKLVSESLPANVVWDQVDARTMPISKVNRRSRLLSRDPNQSAMKSSYSGTKPGIQSTSLRGRKRVSLELRRNCGRIGVDVRAVNTLNSYLTDTAKILPRRKSGLTKMSQKQLAKAVKTARHMALLNPEPKGPTMDELLEMSKDFLADE